MALKAEVVTRLQDLEPLREPWDRLRQESGTSIFTSHLWTTVWLRHFSDLASPRVVLLWEGDELVGVAPFVLHRAKFMRYPVSYLCLAGNVGETTEYHDLGFPRRQGSDDVLPALAAAMAKLRWNMLQLRDLRWDADAQALLDESSSRWPCESMPSKPCPFVTLDPERDVLSQFEVRSGRKVKRILETLDKEGRIDQATVSRPEMVARSVDIYVEQHKQRWASKGGSIFHEPRQADFLKEISVRSAEREEMLVYEVRIDGKVASQQICIIDGQVVRMYKIGMDDQFRSLAPGYLSVHYAMAETQAAGFKEFDLGPGPEEYKYKVGGVDRWTHNIQGKRGSMMLMSRAAKLPGARRLAKMAVRLPGPKRDGG